MAGEGSDRARRYGPLLTIVVAALLAFAVLPSALTLPNPKPSSQEEIAPVPPTATKVNPPVSNFVSLNQATGAGLGSGGGGSRSVSTPPGALIPPPPPIPPGLGIAPPSTYDCVDGRQTEDPLSPTCVPYYQGNNGGATYQGVTGSLVKILIYFDPYSTLNTSQGASTPPYNTIVNLDAPPQPHEVPQVYVNRAWEKFFDTRYAAYDRHVRFYVQFGSYDDQGLETPGTQTQDAAFGYAEVHPFAIINYASFGNGAYYNTYMAQHQVLVFGSVAGRTQSFYEQYPGLQWGYPPPIERSARHYADFVCSSLAGKPADQVGSGNTPGTIANGQPRKYGLLYTTDPAFQSLEQEALEAAADIKSDCGITPAVTVTYPHNSYSVDNSETPQYAVQDALKLKQAGVTTVLWPAGYEDKIAQAADQESYYPEWLIGDDPQQASNFGEQFQDQREWADAWIVTSQTYLPGMTDQICYQEYRSVDSTSADSDVENFACQYYPDLRQLFTGIQVAGPDLTPSSVDQGFHAIPPVASSNPQVPACFYLANDYTCVKDSAVEFWNPSGQSQTNAQPGCWQMVDGGRRYLPGAFPTANLAALRNPNDPCNNFNEAANLDLGPPSP